MSRQRMVNDFNAPNGTAQLFLVSTGAGSVGEYMDFIYNVSLPH